MNQLKAGIVPGDEQPEKNTPELDSNQVSLNYGGEINPVGTLQVTKSYLLSNTSVHSMKFFGY